MFLKLSTGFAFQCKFCRLAAYVGLIIFKDNTRVVKISYIVFDTLKAILNGLLRDKIIVLYILL